MKKKSSSFYIYIIALAAILIGFVIVFFIWRHDVTQAINVKIVNDALPLTDEGKVPEGEAVPEHKDSGENIDIYVTVSKSWKNTDDFGAQYDGFIKNNSVAVVYNWSLDINLPDDGTIDSAWNGTYETDGRTINVKPDENTNMIAPEGMQTFGFVMLSPEVLDIRDFSFTGHRFAKITDYPMFWSMVVLLIIWGIFVITSLIIHFRMAKLKQQKLHDEMVIDEMMHTFARIIDVKDESTRGHSLRVSYYSKMIGEKMGMDENEVKNLGYIALVHDCGKIGVPDLVLNKAGALTDEERKEMQKHTVYGGKILSGFDSIEGIINGAIYHHERYDGKGYPEGIKGKDIPLYARIIGVADSFDAMNSDRCYRKHLSAEKILEELENNAGTQFDPDIAQIMIKMVKDGLIEEMKGKADIISQEVIKLK
ncbi:MAG: HD domain-containing protein [Lachnospiraceae bacterium]|nr:HD domain-containing protein [Lachnospiraceae bacterium]